MLWYIFNVRFAAVEDIYDYQKFWAVSRICFYKIKQNHCAATRLLLDTNLGATILNLNSTRLKLVNGRSIGASEIRFSKHQAIA